MLLWSTWRERGVSNDGIMYLSKHWIWISTGIIPLKGIIMFVIGQNCYFETLICLLHCIVKISGLSGLLKWWIKFSILEHCAMISKRSPSWSSDQQDWVTAVLPVSSRMTGECAPLCTTWPGPEGDEKLVSLITVPHVPPTQQPVWCASLTCTCADLVA